MNGATTSAPETQATHAGEDLVHVCSRHFMESPEGPDCTSDCVAFCGMPYPGTGRVAETDLAPEAAICVVCDAESIRIIRERVGDRS
jgi:hypothetical protein